MAKWERDLGCSFNDLQWQDALIANYTFLQLVGTHLQILPHRWYNTPSLIHPYNPYVGEIVVFPAHSIIPFGSALKSPYWKEVIHLLTEVTGTPVSPTLEFALLSIGIEKCTHHIRCVIIHILLAVRLTIVWHWKSNDHITVVNLTPMASMNACSLCLKVVYPMPTIIGHLDLTGTKGPSLAILKKIPICLGLYVIWFNPLVFIILCNCVASVSQAFIFLETLMIVNHK